VRYQAFKIDNNLTLSQIKKKLNLIAKIFFIRFNIDMNIQKIQTHTNFKQNSNPTQNKKPEFIDKLMSIVQNQDDVNDCVAVPRGIFKAYLWIMGGFGLLGISGALPQKFAKTKSALAIIGNLCNAISAFYFAKPFAFKNVSPTVKPKDLNTRV